MSTCTSTSPRATYFANTCGSWGAFVDKTGFTEESTWEPAAHFKSQTLQAYHAKCKEDKAEQTDSSSEDDEDEQAPSKQSKRGKRSSRQQALANLSCTSQTGGQRQGPIEDTPRINGSHKEPIKESKHHATYGSQD